MRAFRYSPTGIPNPCTTDERQSALPKRSRLRTELLTVHSLLPLGKCTCPQLCLKTINYYASFIVGAVWLATLLLISLQIYEDVF